MWEFVLHNKELKIFGCAMVGWTKQTVLKHQLGIRKICFSDMLQVKFFTKEIISSLINDDSN